MGRCSWKLVWAPVVGAVVTCLIASTTAAAEHRIHCPTEVYPSPNKSVKTPAGWTGFGPLEIERPLQLEAARVMFGPPSDMAVSVADSTKKSKGKTIEKWIDLKTLRPSGGKWLACFYGGEQDFILSQKIDDETSSCTVTYAGGRGNKALDVRCNW